MIRLSAENTSHAALLACAVAGALVAVLTLAFGLPASGLLHPSMRLPPGAIPLLTLDFERSSHFRAPPWMPWRATEVQLLPAPGLPTGQGVVPADGAGAALFLPDFVNVPAIPGLTIGLDLVDMTRSSAVSGGLILNLAITDGEGRTRWKRYGLMLERAENAAMPVIESLDAAGALTRRVTPLAPRRNVSGRNITRLTAHFVKYAGSGQAIDFCVDGRFIHRARTGGPDDQARLVRIILPPARNATASLVADNLFLARSGGQVPATVSETDAGSACKAVDN